MQDTQAFAPFYKVSRPAASQAGPLFASVKVTVSDGGATASGVIAGAPTGPANQIRIANKTTAWAHINFGVVSQTVPAATVASSMPVAPGAVEVVTVEQEVDGASVILDAASTGGTTVVLTRGGGV